MSGVIVKNTNKFITTYYSKYYSKIAIKHTFLIPRNKTVYIYHRKTQKILKI